MINKPNYHILNNTKYALDGLRVAVKEEKSFKIELIFFVILQIFLYFISIELVYKMILSISLFLPLLAELINSAIERVVDLVTSDIHPLAKDAKDLGSSVVFVSITITSLIWISIFYLEFV